MIGRPCAGDSLPYRTCGFGLRLPELIAQRGTKCASDVELINNTKNKLVQVSELRYGEVAMPELVRVGLMEMVTPEEENRFI